MQTQRSGGAGSPCGTQPPQAPISERHRAPGVFCHFAPRPNSTLAPASTCLSNSRPSRAPHHTHWPPSRLAPAHAVLPHGQPLHPVPAAEALSPLTMEVRAGQAWPLFSLRKGFCEGLPPSCPHTQPPHTHVISVPLERELSNTRRCPPSSLPEAQV